MASSVGQGVIASFVVDVDPVYPYMGWNLAHSLALRSGFQWEDIHVQFTPEVGKDVVEAFEKLGCSTHRLTRFGDGKFCNKLAQWDALRGTEADTVIFLDTDMICLSDILEFIPRDRLAAKIVDLANPPTEMLDMLFDRFGLAGRPELVRVDADTAMTYAGNCNGGLYSVPTRIADQLFGVWREFALRLLDDLVPLAAIGKEIHVDQIAFCMAIHHLNVPLHELPSNLNYFAHFRGRHGYLEHDRPIALLHYHASTFNVLGVLEPKWGPNEQEIKAFEDANGIIEQVFNTRMFWEMRYARFPERGSGVGSRGENLVYKRNLLRREGAEAFSSVLDVGCGDLEVVRTLDLKGYTGIDASKRSLDAAARARPDWDFKLSSESDIPSANLVLCLEVAIHQKTAEEYRGLMSLLAEKTERTLIISGFDAPSGEISSNHMVFFYEPLQDSLEAMQKFKTIRRIGQHTTVSVFRCDV